MRRAVVAGAAAAAILGVVATANAGPEAGDANGNFVVLDADMNPPVTRKGKAVPTTVNLEVVFGNKRTGSPFPTTETFDFALPSGARYNGKQFPQCPLPATPAEVATDRCTRATRIGSGKAVIDARRLGLQNPVNATLTAYNGELRNGRPTQIIIAKATVGGNEVASEIDMEYSGGRFRLFRPTGASRSQFSYSSFSLKTGAIFKSKTPGNRAVLHSLWQTPKKCGARGWAWTFSHTDTNGGRITATDRQPCAKAS